MGDNRRISPAWFLVFTGLVFGGIATVLVRYGNPPNMGVCAACFLRDCTGALGLHHIAKLSYFRPEILGFILGSFILSLTTREFRAEGGSAPLLRLFISALVMIGALVFLGCPVRMVLRLAGGDVTAIAGLAGFIGGIWAGVLLLKQGFSLGRSHRLPQVNGVILPALTLGMLVLLLVRPTFVTLATKGHAPVALSLGAGLVVGALAQRSRLCFAGGIRNLILVRETLLFQGLVAVFAGALIGNLITGQFNWGAHPIAHTSVPWNFLGMAVVGLGSVLIGGCPLRQMILAGQGNTDSALSVIGMILGAAFAHNYLLASTPAGPRFNGEVVVVAGLVLLLIIGLVHRET